MTTARPIQAALTSTATFATGAALPLEFVFVTPLNSLVPIVSIASLLFLELSGGVGARAGGARMSPAIMRVTFRGAIAIALTARIGRVFGAAL